MNCIAVRSFVMRSPISWNSCPPDKHDVDTQILTNINVVDHEALERRVVFLRNAIRELVQKPSRRNKFQIHGKFAVIGTQLTRETEARRHPAHRHMVQVSVGWSGESHCVTTSVAEKTVAFSMCFFCKLAGLLLRGEPWLAQ